jgi:Kef-type K+ transport system membrane component KefB
MSALAAITLSPQTFLAIVAASAVAGTLSATVRIGGLGAPAVVIELLLGVVLGPHVLGFHVSQFIQFFSDLGLGLLFYFAGYEIDLHRISGEPLRLALLGWALSLVIAYALGGLLAAAGVVISLLYTGSALRAYAGRAASRAVCAFL